MVSTSGISLITLGILVLVVPGILYNNLNNNGLVVSQAQALTCSSDVQTPTCQISGNVGCQSSSAYCQLSGSSISFLSGCSPFTNLLTLNFIGFVNSFFNNCNGTAGVQTNQGGLPQNGNVTIPGLKATYSFHTVANQRQWATSLVLHPTPQGLTTPYYVSCLSFNGSGYGTGGTNTAVWPCNFVDSSNPQIGYTMNCWLYGNSTDVNNAICTNWSGSTTGSVNFGTVMGFGLWLLGAAILIFIALGISFGAGGSFLASGANFSFGSNRQGTKFAQVFGIVLVFWLPLYSEFSTWFTSGLLPYGFDGSVGIVAIGLLAITFFGTYKQATSD